MRRTTDASRPTLSISKTRDVATAATIPPDRLVPGVAAWKIRNTPSPGVLFAFYKRLRRNDFYITRIS